MRRSRLKALYLPKLKEAEKKKREREEEEEGKAVRPDCVWHVYSQDGSYDRIFSTLDLAMDAVKSEMMLSTLIDPKCCVICFVPDAKKITKQSLWDKFENETKKGMLSTCSVCQKERRQCEAKTGHPTINPFLVCLACDSHGYMIPGQGWNVGE